MSAASSTTNSPESPHILVFVSSGLSYRRQNASSQELVAGAELAWRTLAARGHPIEFIAEGAPVASWIDRAVAAKIIVLLIPNVELFFLIRHRLRLRSKLVLYGHGSGSTGCSWLFMHTRKPLLFEGDLWIAPCEAERRALRQSFPKARVAVIPFPFLGERGPARRSPHPGHFLLYAGRVIASKELHTLFCALALLKRKYPDVHLEIVGAADPRSSASIGIRPQDYKRYLQRLARELGISGNIRWKGWLTRERTNRLQARTPHVFVSPAIQWSEYFGLAPLHSLMSRNPAVLSAWGGFLDLHRTFRSQVLLCPVRYSEWGPVISPAELARAIAASFGRKGSASARYDIAPVTDQLERSLRKLLKVRRGKALRASLLVRAFPPPRVTGWRFSSYDDRSSWPIAESYGMPVRPGPCPRGTLLVPPWVRILETTIEVRDPRRGHRVLQIGGSGKWRRVRDFRGKSWRIPARAARWLWANGSAFELKSP